MSGTFRSFTSVSIFVWVLTLFGVALFQQDSRPTWLQRRAAFVVENLPTHPGDHLWGSLAALSGPEATYIPDNPGLVESLVSGSPVRCDGDLKPEEDAFCEWVKGIEPILSDYRAGKITSDVLLETVHRAAEKHSADFTNGLAKWRARWLAQFLVIVAVPTFVFLLSRLPREYLDEKPREDKRQQAWSWSSGRRIFVWLIPLNFLALYGMSIALLDHFFDLPRAPLIFGAGLFCALVLALKMCVLHKLAVGNLNSQPNVATVGDLLPYQEAAVENLESRVRQSIARRGNAVIRLEGRPGTGKTRVLQSFVARALTVEEGEQTPTENNPSDPLKNGFVAAYYDVWNHQTEDDLYRSVVLCALSTPTNLLGLRWLSLPTWFVLGFGTALNGTRIRSALKTPGSSVEFDLGIPELTGQNHLASLVRRLERKGLNLVVVFDELDRASDLVSQSLLSLVQRGFDLRSLTAVISYVPGYSESATISPSRVRLPDLVSMVASHHWLEMSKPAGEISELYVENISGNGSAMPADLHIESARASERSGWLSLQVQSQLVVRLFGEKVDIGDIPVYDFGLLVAEKAWGFTFAKEAERTLADANEEDNCPRLLLQNRFKQIWTSLNSDEDSIVSGSVIDLRSATDDFLTAMKVIDVKAAPRIRAMLRDESADVTAAVSQLAFAAIVISALRYVAATQQSTNGQQGKGKP